MLGDTRWRGAALAALGVWVAAITGCASIGDRSGAGGDDDGGGDEVDGGAPFEGCEPGSCDDDCPDVAVELVPRVPTVVFLIDQSESMENLFGGASRWGAVRDALTAPTDGVLARFGGRLAVGATLFTSNGGGPTCPVLLSAAPAAGGVDAVVALLAANEPVDDAPTGEALAATVAAMPAGDGRFVLLATDGDPDTCAAPEANGDQGPRDVAEEAVEAAFGAGVGTLVVSIADEADRTHVDRMARAGRGQDRDDGDAAALIADDPAELAAAFAEMIAGTHDCRIPVAAQIDAALAGEGRVELDGEKLKHDLGWRLADAGTIELLGLACDAYRAAEEVSLTATFPCDAVQPD